MGNNAVDPLKQAWQLLSLICELINADIFIMGNKLEHAEQPGGCCLKKNNEVYLDRREIRSADKPADQRKKAPGRTNQKKQYCVVFLAQYTRPNVDDHPVLDMQDGSHVHQLTVGLKAVKPVTIPSYSLLIAFSDIKGDLYKWN